MYHTIRFLSNAMLTVFLKLTGKALADPFHLADNIARTEVIFSKPMRNFKMLEYSYMFALSYFFTCSLVDLKNGRKF